MGLKKGQTNNPAGKPPGTKNKVNAELREMISDFLNGEFDTIKADFKKLEPKDRMKVYTDLLNYGLPRLQATTLDIDFEALTEDQLQKIIDGLLERAQNNE